MCEDTDFSPDWLDLIKSDDLPLKSSITNSPFYSSYFEQLPQNGLPAHIGFRICAIRETFEESGVLLVRSLVKDNNTKDMTCLVSRILSPNEIISWRKKIHNDPSVFMDFCR